MRVSSIFLLGLFFAYGAAIEPAQAAQASGGSRLSVIPADYHGKWRENPAQCGDMTETGLDISAAGFKYYGHSLAANSTRKTGPRSIAVTYTVQKDELGGTIYGQDWTMSYELSADGRILSETDTSGDRVRRVRCANSVVPATTSRSAQIAIESFIGEWEDGGPACASLQRGRTATSVVFRAWYCEAGQQSATPITLERLGDRVFAHQATDLSVVVHSNRMMNVDAGPRSLKRFGDGLYVTEAGRFYNKKTTPSQTSTQGSAVAKLPQLRVGAYVVAGTTCGQASNSTLVWWNGQSFSGGRQHPAYPELIGQNRYIASTRGWEDNKVYRVAINVKSQTAYERDGVRFGYCSEASLPAMWRGSTPPQKKLSSGPAMVEEASPAAAKAVTPAEFKEWQGNGNSYGYFCTVATQGGPLALRSVPAGRQTGSLPNGTNFVLNAVRITANGESWYLTDPVDRNAGGWVSARFVSCNPEHFD